MLITFVLTCFILFIFPQQGKTLKEDFLVYYPEAKGNVAMLKEACRKSYHCLGFTTDGALRSSIDVRKWKDDSSVTLYARGLYVHNLGFRCLCYEIVLPWYTNYTCHMSWRCMWQYDIYHYIR